MQYPKQHTTKLQAYRFESEADAIAAVSTINNGEGIPVNETSETQTYALPFEQGGVWYIKADAVTDKYIPGDAVQVEVAVQ